MFGYVSGARALAAVVVSGVLLAGCSGGPPAEPAAAPVPPPVQVAPPMPPGAVPAPGAVGIAQAAADPTKLFTLTAGEPARCLASQGGSTSDGDTVLDGRALLDRCRPTEGQAWAFRAMPDGTYRLANRTPGGALCFEGSPRSARDSAANMPCGASAGQVWYVAPTSAGFHRMRTAASTDLCLGLRPTPPGAPTAASGDPVTGSAEVAMVPCEPLQVPPGAPRSGQDWELRPAPPIPAPRTTTTTTPPPTTTSKPKPRATATDGLLASVNAERAAAGCGPVRRDASLDRAAEAHGEWMASGGAFSHTGRGGTSPDERIEAAGWAGSASGENIAEGQTSTDEVMTDWMNSAGHRRNILDCEFTSIGLAKVGSDPMWVQTFGG